MATWGPTTVPRPGRTWVSESQQMQTTLRDAEEIAANESDEFEVIEREKARKAFMINAQNERVTNKARERLAQLALHKYGGVRQMFECLDRNNDKELSLDEFSHALKRRNLEKLFPRRAARVLALCVSRESRRSRALAWDGSRRWRRGGAVERRHSNSGVESKRLASTAWSGGRTASDARATPRTHE
jgi:hypothetical protein